jgi:hypothetical protein
MASPPQEPPKPLSKYRYKCTFSGTVSDAMKRRGWSQTEDHDWDVYWCDLTQFREIFAVGSKPLNDFQRVGHFRNCQEMSRKNMLVRNLKRFKYRLERAFGPAVAKKMDYVPITYILPVSFA